MTDLGEGTPERSIIIVDNQLPVGNAANAAAVLAFTLGQRHPALVGAPFLDASEGGHPGLIYTGISILGASQDELAIVRSKALERGTCDVVDFPAEGQTTVDYAEFCKIMRSITPDKIKYIAVGLCGARKTINKLVGDFRLLR